MKSIVLCEPVYGDKKEEDRASNKTKNKRTRNARTRRLPVKNASSLSDIEICMVVGNAVDGGEKTDMRKDGSTETEKEKGSLGADCITGESVEPSDETRKEDEDIEILSCTIDTGVSKKSVPLRANGGDLGVEDTDSSSQRREHDVDSNEIGVGESYGVEPCGTEDKDELGGAEESEDHVEGAERLSGDESGVQKRAVRELDPEETEADSRGKHSSDEGFIEEEENKENRNAEGDTKKRRNESTWEAEESFQSWNRKKEDNYGSQEKNGQEICLAESEMVVDLIGGGDTEGWSWSGEGNVPVGSSENKAEESCANRSKVKPKEKGKTEDDAMQKRKRRSLDSRVVVNSSAKKRRMTGSEGAGGKVKRRHSYDASFPDNTKSQSCHEFGDNEDEDEKPNEDHKKKTVEESIDSVASAQISLPFLESLRGTIKALSRNDLEELIVQKLCEVITERSTVGILRKKAQALEQDQERWKEKVQSLTKQLREMDMVMKKYMSEVQKQGKERNFQMVTPLRVTRSVGLQVSFGSLNSKLSKVIWNINQTQLTMQTPEKVTKQSSQVPVSVSSNARKNLPIVPSNQGNKAAKDLKKPFSPRPGSNVTLQARLISPQKVIAPNAAIQTQQVNPVNRPRHPGVDQNNSKIIDLTEDDDRQNSHTTPKAVLQPSVIVRPPGQIRVVSHVQPTQANAAGRVAYLVPATTAAASDSTVTPQSRQLLIATPTGQPPPRQLLPSVPPLLYKGSTILQPGSQQPAIINQPSRALIPKPLKHPAPLPQPPTNQIQKPNLKLLPPRPALKISKVQTGIVLSWNMVLGPEYEPIASYQLYAYQENNSPPTTSLWKKVGDVKALPLPMACTLTQFMSGHKYYFAVRAVDLHSRIGPFSFPGSIVLIK